MPHSGEVALQIPASVEGIVSSAYENRENGNALRSSAATVRCPQVRAERGSRSRRIAMAATRTAVPANSRPKVTWNGAYPSVPTLISRKLKPQMRESATNRTRQSRAGRGVDDGRRSASGARAVAAGGGSGAAEADGAGGEGGDAGGVAAGSRGALMGSA
ncbi:hypothetical protein F610DRAFT_04854 [Streptomyces sp. LaPpAH-199]|nr:hypothetical protein F610DRAFT_04854 [Streptomyces sp. LaPpAH-199]